MALVKVEDISAIYAMMETVDYTAKGETTESGQYVEDCIPDDDNIPLLSSEEGTEIAKTFAQNVFLDDRSIDAKSTDYMWKASSNQQYYTFFDGPRIDTGTERSSEISINQYRAYCKSLSLLESITPSHNPSNAGTGGKEASIAVDTIRIWVEMFRVVVDGAFIVLEDSTPTILSTEGKFDSGFNISI